MTLDEVRRVDGKNGAFRLLYSHDGGFWRHCVEVMPDGYACLIQESYCFTRGTHQAMARLHGVDLSALECQTFREASYLMR